MEEHMGLKNYLKGKMETQNKKEIKLSENVTIDLAFEALLKNHLRQIKRDGIIDEIRKKRYYIKPSALKREKAKKLIRR